MRQYSRFLLALLLLVESTDAFVGRTPPAKSTTTTTARHMAASVNDRTQSFALSMEEINPLVDFGSPEKPKVVNAFGVWCAVVSVLTGPIWSAVMAAMQMYYKAKPEVDPERALYDATGKVWSKVWLTMTGCFPTVTGDVQALKEGHGPCLYVANHASWMDIPLLCTVLDPVFKFIAKGELSKVPCIGQQLSGVRSFWMCVASAVCAGLLQGSARILGGIFWKNENLQPVVVCLISFVHLFIVICLCRGHTVPLHFCTGRAHFD